MKAWEDMTRIEKMRAEYSDLHKDVYGMRPDYVCVNSWTDEQLEAEFNNLVNLLESDNV
jgi:hypothetical protein